MATINWNHGYPVSRRTQFSSCDGCRQARVACDASKFGHQPGEEAAWSASCSRCALRRRGCTFEWMKKVPRNHRRSSKARPSSASNHEDFDDPTVLPDSIASLDRHEDSVIGTYLYETSQIATTSEPPSETFLHEPDTCFADGSSSGNQLVDILLTRCADTIFSQGFGVIFARWVGRNGCPLVDEPMSDISMPPLKLFHDLDLYMDQQLSHSTVETVGTTIQRSERHKVIDQCLRSALQAYTARWLPLILQRESNGQSLPYDEISRSCWRAARRDMLKVINRPSYRSVFALYLFGQSPVPLGIPQEEELDGISGVVCIQTAFLHVQQLRERLRSCQFNGSEVSAWSDASMMGEMSGPGHSLTEEFVNLESRAYWATVTWDTSDSMTLNFRSTLCSGLKGACGEPVWQLTKAFLTSSFHGRSEEWRKKGFRVSSSLAPQIISATSICAIYTWRTIASLKEALREGVGEGTVEFAWTALLDAIEIFQTTIQPLISNCERQLHFLSQADRFNWYVVVLLYYLGILILVDALEAAKRRDLLLQLTGIHLEAEQECFNVLKFGLESTYTIVTSQAGSSQAFDSSLSASPLSVSFVAIDPYPHHVIAAVRLMNKAFLRQCLQSTMEEEAYGQVAMTLRKALDQLPPNSKAVQSAKENMEESMRGYAHSI